MSARISIDLDAPTAPYEQIRAQLAAMIAVGAVQPGARLPTVRMLALDLGVAAGTAARAYKELEAAGMVSTRRRHGTVVSTTLGEVPGGGAHTAGTAGAAAHHAAAREVGAAVEQLILTGRAAGLSNDDLLNLLRGRLNQLRDG
ncbi:GntR family transcriptional regulator [Arthrobacter sp. 35W]|uniref:GntR family transcriptional regulator n=1 Tax=Arthrobacter sp. 35W TaxID=1132441 RepID=UPI00040830D9|nr:GntR family transcriptional regulator [Arthrobacter sp. 35W]